MTSLQSVTGERSKRSESKQAVVIDDSLFPMPRRKLTARDILEQACSPKNVVLKRDYNDRNDHVFGDDEVVDLAEGNVFKTIPRCEPSRNEKPTAKPKLAYVADDAWEITLAAKQTGHSLKRLLGLPDDASLFRDFESGNDEPIRDDEEVLFADGPVFTSKGFAITIKVNNKPVKVVKRRMSGLEIKQAAIAQGVEIQETFVLYARDKEGNLGPAIPNDQIVSLHDCDEFRCVAADDNS